jgi:RimJ/RimL family protein N-acetyltransferase
MSKEIKRSKTIPTLLTERLCLSPLTLVDLQDFLIHRNHPEVGRYQNWFPVQEEQVIELITIQNSIPFGSLGPWFQFGVHLLPGQQLIGGLGLHFVSQTPYQAEIGYSIAPAYQKQGYATESVQAVIDYGFNKFSLQTIAATIDTRNSASRKLLERLGFHQMAYRPHASFVRDEWCDEMDFCLSAVQWQKEYILPKC